MKRLSAALSFVAVLALVAGLVVSVAGASQGTVVYRVEGSANLSGLGVGGANASPPPPPPPRST